MAFAEDLSVFFDVDGGFAVMASRTPAAGGVSPDAAVIFDVNGLNHEEFEVVTAEPALIVPASVWPSLAEADLLSIESSDTVEGGDFKVRQTYPVRDGAIAVAILAAV